MEIDTGSIWSKVAAGAEEGDFVGEFVYLRAADEDYFAFCT